MSVKSVTVRVPAKVNLQLSVGPRESDGFHNLVTVFQAISIYDDITVTFAPAKSGVSISISGDQRHGVPADDSNLAMKAIALMAKEYDLVIDAHVEIKKSIPVAGGMAGGSADAAAAIVAIDYLYSLGMSREEMSEVAAQLGSDVPFMLSGGTAIGTGHGDQLTAALSRGTYHWVLALSSVGLSTPAVYGECDRLRSELEIAEPATNEQLMQALLAADPKAVGAHLVNDLQAAACSLRPALRLVLDVGQEYGALGALVSGSGPTVAFLVSDEEAGLDLAVALTASGVVGSVARAYGPVAGAKVLT
ncbi:MAG: 4-(cytidine 5'-diphospho)-2-C-methyl-D-erythritol kinase [Actinobacteria bacterium]|uniref:4-(cytidine 5'-diphospho)-2-C-methyl-D-erythritol kinase n=1 Tax=freshwater metagenome TaxID=449393 RepID=A0A6J6T4S0_9ZZZZ|nr:4-(cytidine 5'-diphospho)-2-C-methyl-D-erythritol kinase [Actinomycetota bacterium]MSY63780.1 4-(cytidine 5'-diphospho)-2-C-methyl-D-erythritol kinase [Actinomycetota bacterium]MSZ91098.1 4-(cytidine 5'-diphospho)-2-C-methyl-D-erythritol kinase [Actinomycetota bacterium]